MPYDEKLTELLNKMADSPQAQAEVYKILYRLLTRSGVARKYRDDMVDEAFQETMIAVWKGHAKREERTMVVSWAYTIFRNKLVDQMRTAHPDRTVNLDDDEWEALAQIDEDAESDPVKRLEASRVRQHLEQCLKSVEKKSPIAGNVLSLCLQGFSMKEIAAVEERPVGTIQRMVFEAREKLVQCLNRHGVQHAEG